MGDTSPTNRRAFMNALGVTVGSAGLGVAGMIGGSRVLKAATEPAKGGFPTHRTRSVT